ncbi:MAG: DUF4197 domain-containing protein [Bacteroidetes bacterium]|nr:MAG: DUF4197 domain-containing protein [Bacteroidota bacterium]
MFKKLFALLLCTQLVACDPAALQQMMDGVGGLTQAPLSNADIAAGLKEALEIGITKGAEALSKEDGYFKSPYKILLPPEARQITEKLQKVPGFSNIEEVLLEKINRGAEDAAKRAAPIFANAIKQMTFSDVMDILMGADNAATDYLQRTTFDQLYSEFNPVIVESLDKFKARKVWENAVNTYNKLPFSQKANPDLDDYVTREALKGLFSRVEVEEKNIRTNVSARTTDLLKRVFAKQDNR